MGIDSVPGLPCLRKSKANKSRKSQLCGLNLVSELDKNADDFTYFLLPVGPNGDE